jgi:hypothetical protein
MVSRLGVRGGWRPHKKQITKDKNQEIPNPKSHPHVRDEIRSEIQFQISDLKSSTLPGVSNYLAADSDNPSLIAP